ncbi:YfcC family protein [Levilactobacillus cerevisiae]|uniref:YfcC family protein n=1 Tax=Levilactobacillus cerevisiae TaxID=1704076 RepID=UPI000F78A7CE|nr:YfcC family protein [Levilactobacillus cerevisiae]
MTNKTKKRFRFQMPTAFTILFWLIVLMAVLTWVIPAGAYQTNSAGQLTTGTYHTVKSQPQGIWNVFMAPITGMIGNQHTVGAIDISLFILVIGGFLGVVNQTGALDDGIKVIVDKSRGHEKRLIVTLIILFSLGGSTYGMGEETLAFVPLLTPVMMSVGYDPIVSAAVIMLSTRVGDLASTVNPFTTGLASGIIGISPGRGLLSRLILWVIVTGIETWYVLHYASKIKADPTKSLVYHLREENERRFMTATNSKATGAITKVQRRVLLVFALTFGIMILGLVPWTSINAHWTFFESLNHLIVTTPILGTIVGHKMVALGSWYFNEITLLFFFMSVVVMAVGHIREKAFMDAFIKGMQDLLSVAIIVGVARGIQVVMNDGKITATLLHYGEKSLTGMPKGPFIICAFIFFVLLAFLIPSTSGLAAATMGVMGSLAHFAHIDGSIMVSAYQSAAGLVTAITPTAGMLVGALTLANVSFSVWWRWTAKLIVILFCVSCVFLVILTLL